MEEDLHATGEPVECPHCLVEQLGRTGFGIPAMEPVEVKISCRREGLLFGLVGDLDERDSLGVTVETFEGGADRRDRCLVADEEVPVGGGIGRIRTAGSAQMHNVAGLGAHRPRTRIALIANRISAITIRVVHDEVDGEFFGLLIDPTDRVGTQYRPGVLRHDVAHLVQVQRLGINRVGVEKDEFHIAVSRRASRKRGQLVAPQEERSKAAAAEHNAPHVRRQSLGADNDEFDWLALAHAV